jgi:16S rRNA (guanine527-N7)-methyltransferase
MDQPDRSSLSRRPSLPRSADDLPDLPADYQAAIEDGLAAIPVELTAAQRAAIDSHVRLLIAWNAHINLSGLRTPLDIARGHVLDALVALPALRRLGATSLIDLGSGGGFPGLPLAVALPVRRAALVDSIGKKASFLEAAAGVVVEKLRGAATASVDVAALPERAEDLADEPDQREGWDLVTLRAVGTVAESAEVGLPLARRGGHVAIWKRGRGSEELRAEIRRASRIVQAAGGAPPRVVELEAAHRIGLDGNCLVLIRKVRPTPDRYPRPPGERRRAALA